MSLGHQVAHAGAITGGIALLAGMLLGAHPLPEMLGVPGHSIREVSVALWAFGLPLWFSIEEYWVPTSEPELTAFRKSQQLGKQIWTGLGGAAAIVIGLAPAPIAQAVLPGAAPTQTSESPAVAPPKNQN